MPDSDAAAPTADDAPTRTRAAPVNEALETIKTVAGVALIFLVIRVLLFQPFTIPSASMVPNLLIGDYIVVSKYAYGYSRHSVPFSPPLFKGRLFDQTPHRGDIVVFKLPRDGHTDYIKRLIGLPGDRIQMKGGVVWLNGKPLPRQEMAPGTETSPFGYTHAVQRFKETMPEGKSYTTNDYGPDGEVDNTGVFVVPPKTYFMMGDNRDNSQDSRFPEEIGVGYVPEENLVGRADIVLFSWTEKASLLKPWTWVLDIRPDRFFHPL